MRLDCHNYPLEASELVGRHKHAYNHALSIVTVDDEIKPQSVGAGG